MPAPDQVIIFGASGDLTHRKLIPALLNNHISGALKRPIQVVGVARAAKTHEQWRAEMGEALPPELREAWAEFASNTYYCRADATDPTQVREFKAVVDRVLAEAGGTPETCGRLFYLALSPNLFGPVIDALCAEKLLECDPEEQVAWRRVVVEKPFG
ncbi:MAG: glucose-6-phosphate dehydrogenase, partial [Myxococcota bacterium]